MEKRVIFNSNKIRDLFFLQILNSFKLKNWKSLSDILKINRNILADYRFGRLTLPEDLYEKLTVKLDKSKVNFFNKNISYKNRNWGNIKGGKSAYLKNKEVFDKGREKAIKVRREKVHRFDINLPLNRELSYFIGLFIGDGFTNKYGRYYLTQFVGHFPSEVNYYKRIVSNISNNLFGIIPKIKKDRVANAIRVNLYSKDLFLMFTKRFKNLSGRKSLTALIPNEILNSEKEIIMSFIAGIYDAEGSFYIDKRKSYKKPYPILELHMHNPRIINKISDLFNKFGIPHYIRDNIRIYFYGEAKINIFLKNVKILNPKITNKIKKFYENSV
ncbi:hypothetical protein CMI40_00215 [Candidatus Pacearchaeota archaeon]|jgi:hypothetical protein|nr:hypothetical protein [Candidatus Pacearchaeota archaeon]|tara:strand:- start:211 stop:1197 length:987 start_codon:yes stop_codon:yes gene_type:complete